MPASHTLNFINVDQIDGLEAVIRSDGNDYFAEKRSGLLWEHDGDGGRTAVGSGDGMGCRGGGGVENGDGGGVENGGAIENGGVFCVHYRIPTLIM